MYLSKKGVRKGEAEEAKADKKSLLDWVQQFYNSTLESAFRGPKLTMLVGLLSILLGGAIMALLPRQLFPKVERNQFAVEIYLPEGYTLAQTVAVADSMEVLLMSDSRVVNVASFMGTSSPRFHTTYAPNFPSKNYAQLVVNTITADDAVAILDEYEAKRNIFPNAYVRMKQLDMLSTTAPIEVRISGNNIDSIKAIAENVKSIMQQNDAVIWARTDYLNKRQGVRVDVNDELANRLGLTRGLIASSIASGFSGIPIGTVWEGDYPVDVKVINPIDKRDGFDDIENQNVTSLFLSATVPVRQVTTITTDWSEGQIIRRNGVRTITVRADVKRGVLPYKILAELKPELKKNKNRFRCSTHVWR